MNRRSFLAAGTAASAFVTAGCISTLDVLRSDPEKVDFEERDGLYLLIVENSLDTPVAATLTTTGVGTEDTYSKELHLGAGERAEITEWFTRADEPYSIRLSTGSDELERTIQPNDSHEDKAVFEITTVGVESRTGHRETPDLGVSNRLPTEATFRITVEEASLGGSGVYDTVTLPAEGFESYDGVFSKGTEYRVTAEAKEKSGSTTHRDSFTNTLWITLEEDELELVESEE